MPLAESQECSAVPHAFLDIIRAELKSAVEDRAAGLHPGDHVVK